jgi:hypothetical protein
MMEVTMKSRLPIMAFALCAVASSSAVAAAGWTRVAVGTGIGNGNVGCSAYPSTNTANAWAYFCPLAVDSDAVAAYTALGVYFQNSNHTQPVSACVTYYASSGGTCSTTTANNCPSGGLCQFSADITAWENHPNDFKYVLFDNITSGARLAGYTLFWE